LLGATADNAPKRARSFRVSFGVKGEVNVSSELVASPRGGCKPSQSSHASIGAEAKAAWHVQTSTEARKPQRREPDMLRQTR
jgi:hypothetical protein